MLQILGTMSMFFLTVTSCGLVGRWRNYASSKRWCLPASPHGVTVHKNESFDVLTAVGMTNLFWVVTLCRFVGRYQRPRETHHFRFQGCRQYISLKHWYLPASLCGVTPQNNNFVTQMIIVCIFRAMIISDPLGWLFVAVFVYVFLMVTLFTSFFKFRDI